MIDCLPCQPIDRNVYYEERWEGSIPTCILLTAGFQVMVYQGPLNRRYIGLGIGVVGKALTSSVIIVYSSKEKITPIELKRYDKPRLYKCIMSCPDRILYTGNHGDFFLNKLI